MLLGDYAEFSFLVVTIFANNERNVSLGTFLITGVGLVRSNDVGPEFDLLVNRGSSCKH